MGTSSDAEVPVPSCADPDADAIAAVLAGEPARFATLVKRHDQALHRACRAVLDDDAEAEDCVQAAWVNAFRALASFRGEASFRTWITRIAVHEAAGRRRQRRREAPAPVEDLALSSQCPERATYADQLGRLLHRAIDTLPDGMRTVLVLRDVLELDTAETAACLAIGEEAVRVRLHRARQTLARTLAASEPELPDRARPARWRFAAARSARVLAAVMAVVVTT